MELLKNLESPADLKKLNRRQLHELADEVRNFIIDTISKTGGHFASNLGTVELAIALHWVFDSPRDKIIWDVGHQAYPHKILTGRWNRFDSLRQYGGLSGFLKLEESPHDAFGAGHSSTSISAALGYALARDQQGQNNKCLAVIGDGALTAGMAFEALNHAGNLETDIMIVLNDNKMSISPNVGAISNYLNRIITGEFYNIWKQRFDEILLRIPMFGSRLGSLANRLEEGLKSLIVPGVLFEEMGFRYFGPIDGHDVDQLIDVFEKTRSMKTPRLIHVITQKGKGYGQAEKDPLKWHGAKKFDKVTGKSEKKTSEKPQVKSYTDIFSDILCELAKEDDRVVAITAAMASGTGLTRFSEEFPNRFFDVGIAEQHAVTMAGGQALGGLKPVAAIYSTFLQRAHDQVLHDICLQDIPVVFAMDRSGIVGADGATHQGLFDIAFLRDLPNIVLMAPTSEEEMHRMFRTALELDHPCAIRYPRGSTPIMERSDDFLKKVEIGKSVTVEEGEDLAILAYGTILDDIRQALPMLHEQGLYPKVINARFAKPIDRELIIELAQRQYQLVTAEEHVLAGGFGSRVLEVLEEEQLYSTEVLRLGVPDRVIEHGDRASVMDQLGLSAQKMANRILDFTNTTHRPTQVLASHGK